MTVIAFDGRVLAADGRMTAHGESIINDQYDKLYEVSVPNLGKCVVGLAGSCMLLGPYLEHLQKEGLAKFPAEDFGGKESCLKGLLITSKGKCIEFDTEGGWFEMTGPTAIGSGSIIAQHYLTKGDNALTAVVETCKTETTCGGTIVTYDCKSKVFMTYEPPHD